MEQLCSCGTLEPLSPLAVPLTHLAFGSVETREAPRMPGPRVVTRVTLELLSTSEFMENVTVASEGSAAHRHLEEIQCENT